MPVAFGNWVALNLWLMAISLLANGQYVVVLLDFFQ